MDVLYALITTKTGIISIACGILMGAMTYEFLCSVEPFLD